MIKPVTVLITGGLGYIGSHTALKLLQQKYNVILVDETGSSNKAMPGTQTGFMVSQSNHEYERAGTEDERGRATAQALNDAACKEQLNAPIILEGDISNIEFMNKVFKNYSIDLIIHCAAYINVQESFINPAKYYRINVTGTRILLDAAMAHGVNKIIFSSSAAVYGSAHSSPITEDCAFAPISPYGRNKAMVEWILPDYNKAYGVNYLALRYFNVAGAMPEYNLGERHEPETHVIPSIIAAALENKPFTIYGNNFKTNDGTCVRDFVHVWDVALAHVKALEYLMAGGESKAINIGSGTGSSVQQVVTAVESLDAKILKKFSHGISGNKHVNIIHAPARLGDPEQLIADITRAKQVLGWQPIMSDLKTIVESAYKFELMNSMQTC